MKIIMCLFLTSLIIMYLSNMCFQAVVERDATIRSTREDNVGVQRSLEDQLAECKTALDDTRVS